MIPATTGDKALLQFTSFVQTCLRTEPEKMQGFKRSKHRLDYFFFKELTGVSIQKELCMFLQVLLVISHRQASVERGFSLNKSLLVDNMEEMSIQCCRLIKDHLLLNKLSPHFLDIIKKILQHARTARQRYEYYLQEKRNKKEQLDKDQQKQILDSEVKDIEGQLHSVEKIVKGLKEKFFVFVEDVEKKKDLSLLSASNALIRKSEETKQDMKKIEEALV